MHWLDWVCDVCSPACCAPIRTLPSSVPQAGPHLLLPLDDEGHQGSGWGSAMSATLPSRPAKSTLPCPVGSGFLGVRFPDKRQQDPQLAGDGGGTPDPPFLLVRRSNEDQPLPCAFRELTPPSRNGAASVDDGMTGPRSMVGS